MLCDRVEDVTYAAGETGDQPVPHHPGAGCKVEESCAGNNGAVENMFLLVLDQGANGAMNDAFRRACQG